MKWSHKRRVEVQVRNNCVSRLVKLQGSVSCWPYERKCGQLRSQDANGVDCRAHPFAIERTRAAIRDLRTKLNISLASVDAVSRRVVAVHGDELASAVRGAHRNADKYVASHRRRAVGLLSPGAQEEGGIKGPPEPTRTAFSIAVSYAAKQQAAPVDAIIWLCVAFHFLSHMNCMYMCYLNS